MRIEGEVVAAVAAIDAEAARKALDAVVVEYESLPVVTDLEAAIAEGSPLVHEGWATSPRVSRYSAARTSSVSGMSLLFS